MRPLLLVDWRKLNVRFCALMWVVAVSIAIVIVVELLPVAAAVHHVVHLAR